MKRSLRHYLETGNKTLTDDGFEILSNNCADATCKAFNIDTSGLNVGGDWTYPMLFGGVTEPSQVFDKLTQDKSRSSPGHLRLPSEPKTYWDIGQKFGANEFVSKAKGFVPNFAGGIRENYPQRQKSFAERLSDWDFSSNRPRVPGPIMGGEPTLSKPKWATHLSDQDFLKWSKTMRDMSPENQETLKKELSKREIERNFPHGKVIPDNVEDMRNFLGLEEEKEYIGGFEPDARRRQKGETHLMEDATRRQFAEEIRQLSGPLIREKRDETDMKYRGIRARSDNLMDDSELGTHFWDAGREYTREFEKGGGGMMGKNKRYWETPTDSLARNKEAWIRQYVWDKTAEERLTKKYGFGRSNNEELGHTAGEELKGIKGALGSRLEQWGDKTAFGRKYAIEKRCCS